MITTKIFTPSLANWELIKNKILFIEKEAFGSGAFGEEKIMTDFLDPKNIVVLLKDQTTDEVVGFTYAKPFEPETDDSPALPGETAWVWDTVIQKEYRGRSLLGQMMSVLEIELKKLGFKYMERNALTANDFAENISKHYKDRIIKNFPLDSRWGPQIFFRIKL